MHGSVDVRQGDATFLADGGELGALIAKLDWTTTQLGPVDAWPQVVKTTVGLILRSPVPIVTLWGVDGIMIYNDAYSIFAGGRHPRLLGSKVREGWPEVADFNDQMMKSVFERGETLSYRDQQLTLYRSGAAEPVWMNLDYSQIVHEDGAPAGVIAIVVETSEKVRAERHLSGERERLLQMFEQAPGFIAMLEGPEHRFSMANEAYFELVDHRDIIGKTLAEALPETIPQGFVDLLHKVYRSGRPFVGTNTPITLQRTDGSREERFVDFIYQPIVDSEDNVSAIFVQGHDVTEQQRAAAALRESEQRFRLVTENAPVMLWMSDSEGHCAYLNKMQREFWGVEEEALADFDWSSTLHEEDKGKLFQKYERAMSAREGFTVEARYRRADGAYRMLHTDARPRLGSEGELLGMIGVNVDITDINEAQQRLQELNETLEARVVDEIVERRAAEMALQQAQKMESIGKLTGGVAHDFNNLLQIISGNLQLLEMDLAGNDRAQRRITNALAGVDRGATLASQLLAFGRRQPLEPKVVNVARLVAGMDDLLHRSIGEAIEIDTLVPDGLWNAFADPTQIENALLNLAINARDAMDGAGKLTIEVRNATLDEDFARQHADVEPGQYVLIAVRDTGCGMSPELVEQVFEPFFTTKPEGKGSGLGLSMVYGFVRQSGGHVQIDSEVGRGTTVLLYLPRVDEQEEPAAGTDATGAGGGSETILLVEDDEEVRSTVGDMLRGLGYTVVLASDAASALSIIESGARPDLLFTDVVMPGPLRSPELARRARKILPDLPVLFTSGYTDDAIVHGGRLDPGIELLAKPYSRKLLARRIREALGRASES